MLGGRFNRRFVAQILCAMFSLTLFASAPKFSADNAIGDVWVKKMPQGRKLVVSTDASMNYFYNADGVNEYSIYLRANLVGKFSENAEEALIFSPKESFSLVMPSLGKDKLIHQNIKFGGNKMFLRPATFMDVAKYSNLAMNPYDWQKDPAKPEFFPHASASSECRGEYVFRAANAISGNVNNKGHGTLATRSWGPEASEGQWLKIDFGRLVRLNKVRILLRADFPHDSYWQSAKLKFSDGTVIDISLSKTAEYQEFNFEEKETQTLEILDLKKADEVSKWCAITDFQAWGRAVLPFEAFKSLNDDKPQDFYLALSSMRLKKGIYKDVLWLYKMLFEAYPIESNWLYRDFAMNILDFAAKTTKEKIEILRKIQKEDFQRLNSKPDFSSYETSLLKLTDDEDVLRLTAKLYAETKSALRKEFLAQLSTHGVKNIAYVESYPLRPSFYGYTEGLSDARGESIFAPDSALCTLEILPDGSVRREVLLNDKNGVFRDPEVSYDAGKILYSHKKSALSDDYHIYELDLNNRTQRQLTSGKCADIEAKYLNNNEIIFNSTRCEQSTDCFNTEVSNLYIMNTQGKFMRRVGFDQVHTTSPSVLADGRVVYTRWDYNDKGQVFPQGLFLMYPDGTYQTEYYGNKSWYPTSILHARQVPDSMKVVATFSGHHTHPKGKLGLIDPSLGRQENSGTTLLAPRLKEDAIRKDAYGQDGAQFAFPYPISENLFLVTHTPLSVNRGSPYPAAYGLYLIDAEGFSELLVNHAYLNCNQPVPIVKRHCPPKMESRVDYSKNTAECFIRNIYYGEGTKGVSKGDIKKVRIIKITPRRAPIGWVFSTNDEGGVRVSGHSTTPIALGEGSWDIKEILGEVPVEADGSVYFEIPARTPVYFQPIDKNGNAISTMRSWTTLQPNEFYSCLGCHGDRDISRPQESNLDKNRKPLKLSKFYDIEGGFSFRKHIQPILNKHCIDCHNDRSAKRISSADGKEMLSVADFAKVENEEILRFIELNKDEPVRAFSLLDVPIKNNAAKREFNDAYYNLLTPKMLDKEPMHANFKGKLINWAGMQSVPTILPPYFRGSAKSELIAMLRSGHGNTAISVPEIDKLSAWIDLYVPYCGDYYESNTWTEKEAEFYKYYEDKFNAANAQDEKNILEYLQNKN